MSTPLIDVRGLHMAYGANPPPGAGIAPNETLVFTVDLVDVSWR